MKRIVLAISAICFLCACDNDVYETHSKNGEFTIKKIKRSGKRNLRGFYVDGFEQKVRYSAVRNGKYAVGDRVTLSYDSIVNKTKSTYKIVLQRRLPVEE